MPLARGHPEGRGRGPEGDTLPPRGRAPRGRGTPRAPRGGRAGAGQGQGDAHPEGGTGTPRGTGPEEDTRRDRGDRGGGQGTRGGPRKSRGPEYGSRGGGPHKDQGLPGHVFPQVRGLIAPRGCALVGECVIWVSSTRNTPETESELTRGESPANLNNVTGTTVLGRLR